MHLGAERLLVVGLRHESGSDAVHSRARANAVYPNAVFMLGKMLNALMLDKLEADLARIQRTNELIAAGERIYGESFAARIAEGISGRRSRPYKKIALVLVRPSQDLGEIAWDVIRRTGLRRYGGVAARWLRRLTEQTDDVSESDLASYVLFDRDYVTDVMELGWNDAAARHAELSALFE
jgi:NTE family protein